MRILHINQDYTTRALHRELIGELRNNGIDTEHILFCPCLKGDDYKPGKNEFCPRLYTKWNKVFFMAKIKRSLNYIESLEVSLLYN